jgi:hypothetical protein
MPLSCGRTLQRFSSTITQRRSSGGGSSATIKAGATGLFMAAAPDLRPGTTSSAALPGMSTRRGRMLGDLGGNGTMPLLTKVSDSTLAAKIEAVGNESARSYALLAQGMQEMQAALALALARKQ